MGLASSHQALAEAIGALAQLVADLSESVRHVEHFALARTRPAAIPALVDSLRNGDARAAHRESYLSREVSAS